MASGLFALLDDVAAIAKLAAASLDDTAAAAMKASAKATGVVVDDAAVTPRYVVGFSPDRELPIVAKIARGSLINKLAILLPGAIALSWLLPAAITPLLMAGGTFLCFEGAEKLWEKLVPHGSADDANVAMDAVEKERQTVAGAIRTDMILSAEIMAISLGTVDDKPIMEQAAALLVVALAMTLLVYGVVALIVKTDDAGVRLARVGNPAIAWLGRAMVSAMPPLLLLLGWVGLAAMLWVGGHIVVDGLTKYGVNTPHDLLHAAMHVVEAGGGLVTWLVEAIGSGLFGLLIGAIVVLVIQIARPRH